MLARHAESLFWTGRYIERAEDTARMLDVTYHGLLESPPHEAPTGVARPARGAATSSRHVRRTLATLDAVVGERVPRARPEEPGLDRVGRRAGRARTPAACASSCPPSCGRPSTRFYLELRARNLRADLEQQPYELYGLVKRRCQTRGRRGGRDDAARRRLALLDARLDARAGRDDVPAAQRALQRAGQRGRSRRVPPLARRAEVGVGVEAFRKAYRRRRWTRPTSSSSCCCRAPSRAASCSACARPRTDLARLAPADAARPVPQRLLGRIRSDLEFRDVPRAARRTACTSMLDQLQDGVRQVADAVAPQYFRNAAGRARRSHPACTPVPERGGSTDAARHPLPHVVHLRRPGARVAERAARLPDRATSTSSSSRYRVSTLAGGAGVLVHRLLGHAGRRVRRARAARRARGRGRGVGRDAASARCSPWRRSSTTLRDRGFRDEHTRVPAADSPHADWGRGVAAEAQPPAPTSPATTVVSRRAGAPPASAESLALTYARARPTSASRSRRCWPRRRASARTTPTSRSRMCRSLGIPARYVSGYLFTTDDATGADAEDGDVVSVQTHAWFEAAIPGFGWLALDPTNQQEVGVRHVKIGHGRDYDDVPPLRGVFAGEASEPRGRRGHPPGQRRRPLRPTPRAAAELSRAATARRKLGHVGAAASSGANRQQQ